MLSVVFIAMTSFPFVTPPHSWSEPAFNLAACQGLVILRIGNACHMCVVALKLERLNYVVLSCIVKFRKNVFCCKASQISYAAGHLSCSLPFQRMNACCY